MPNYNAFQCECIDNAYPRFDPKTESYDDEGHLRDNRRYVRGHVDEYVEKWTGRGPEAFSVVAIQDDTSPTLQIPPQCSVRGIEGGCGIRRTGRAMGGVAGRLYVPVVTFCALLRGIDCKRVYMPVRGGPNIRHRPTAIPIANSDLRRSHSQKSGVRWTQDMILGVLSIYLSCSIG
jgi:hypothetical protein